MREAGHNPGYANTEKEAAMKHYITEYTTPENGKRYATAWLQLNVFGKIFCFSVITIEIQPDLDHSTP